MCYGNKSTNFYQLQNELTRAVLFFVFFRRFFVIKERIAFQVNLFLGKNNIEKYMSKYLLENIKTN